MQTRPSPLAEAIVGALIPRGRREDVLGDLHERCESPAQYLWDVMQVLPFVLGSHVRRTAARRACSAILQLKVWQITLRRRGLGVGQNAAYHIAGINQALGALPPIAGAGPCPYLMAVCTATVWSLTLGVQKLHRLASASIQRHLTRLSETL